MIAKHPVTTALSLLVVLSWSGAAWAQVCTTDEQCPEGSYCAKGASSPGCSDPPNCPEPDVVEEEQGECVAAPVTCESDAECGEYLSCVESGDGTCWVSSDGDMGCDEPDPNAPKYCAPATITCSSDDECPREFECVARAYDCPAIACAEDEPDCVPCQGSATQVCQPKQIACDSDDECPAEWSCGSVVTRDPVDDGREPGSPDAGTSTGDSSTARYCSPDAWGGDVYTTGDAASAEDSGGDDRGAQSSSSSSEGGCSISAGTATGHAGWLLTLLAAGPLAARRRRRR